MEFITDKIGEVADQLYNLRQERYALQKKVDAIAKQEEELKQHLLNVLPDDGAIGVSGVRARVTITTKHVPQVVDWGQFYAHVAANQAFSLMQRRLSDAAIKEILDAGEVVPGVELRELKGLSINKV